jgi:hypothetical protein
MHAGVCFHLLFFEKLKHHRKIKKNFHDLKISCRGGSGVPRKIAEWGGGGHFRGHEKLTTFFAKLPSVDLFLQNDNLTTFFCSSIDPML